MRLQELAHSWHAYIVVCLVFGFALACSPRSTTTAMPTLLPSLQTGPSPSNKTPATAARVPAPSWWPDDLPMPKTAVSVAGPKGQASWTIADTNVEDIRNIVLHEADSARYKSYVIPLSAGSIYDLLMVKDGVTYILNITQGSDISILAGKRVGTMDIQVSGAVNMAVDLPLREYIDLTPTSEVAFGTDVPNPQCEDCRYLVYVHIAPFNGPGVYQSKPAGIYIIDAQLVPGGDIVAGDYRWAQQCTVLVPDASSGSFACAGLENVNDSSKRLNVTGKWQQPPPVP